MAAATYRCGHPKTEANSSEWIDQKTGRLCRKCRICRNARRRKSMKTPEYRAKKRATWAAGNDSRLIELAPNDPRHGTVHGYNGGRCRCDDCKAAISTYHRVRRLKIKARKLGIPIPRELNVVKSVQSLDARFGGDEPRIGGGIWDDPTADAALQAVG